MQIGRIVGCTRVLGVSQGYIGLPIRDTQLKDRTDGLLTPAMESAWLLGSDEIEALVAGAPLILRVLGNSHPPVHLRVDKLRQEEPPGKWE
jgi:hypothetical protein